MSRRDETITLLKKELETAIQSLNGVKTEMARLRSEKEAVRLSEKQIRESIEVLVPQVQALQSVVDHFEKQTGVAMVSLDNKIQNVEEVMQESCKSCLQRRKVCKSCLQARQLSNKIPFFFFIQHILDI